MRTPITDGVTTTVFHIVAHQPRQSAAYFNDKVVWDHLTSLDFTATYGNTYAAAFKFKCQRGLEPHLARRACEELLREALPDIQVIHKKLMGNMIAQELSLASAHLIKRHFPRLTGSIDRSSGPGSINPDHGNYPGGGFGSNQNNAGIFMVNGLNLKLLNVKWIIRGCEGGWFLSQLEEDFETEAFHLIKKALIYTNCANCFNLRKNV